MNCNEFSEVTDLLIISLKSLEHSKEGNPLQAQTDSVPAGFSC